MPATVGEWLATWLVIALLAALLAGSFIGAARIAVEAMR
jgi:hypothetical protein